MDRVSKSSMAANCRFSALFNAVSDTLSRHHGGHCSLLRGNQRNTFLQAGRLTSDGMLGVAVSTAEIVFCQLRIPTRTPVASPSGDVKGMMFWPMRPFSSQCHQNTGNCDFDILRLK